MKYCLVILSLICIFRGAFAQGLNELLNPENAENYGSSRSVVFDGNTPVVLLEAPAETVVPAPNAAEAVPPPVLSQERRTIKLMTPFGHERTAAFVDHTTDRVFFVQVLDDQTLQIEEQVQFVNTRNEGHFTLILLTGKSDNTTAESIRLTGFLLDKKPVPVIQRQTPAGLELSYRGVLPPGVYRFTVRYLLTGRIVRERSVADILIPLSDATWPLMTERFTVVISFPKSTKTYTQQALFGINNQNIPDNGRFETDERGNILYQTTHPLPAYASVSLRLLVDAAALPGAMNTSSSLLFLGSWLGVLAAYMAACVAEARLIRPRTPKQKALKLNPILWGTVTGTVWTPAVRERLLSVEQPIPGLCLLSYPRLLKMISLLRWNAEYIMGVILLIILGLWGVHTYGLVLPGWGLSVMIIAGAGALAVIHRWGSQPRLIRLKQAFYHVLTQTPGGYNLPQREIASYYIRATCLGFGADWLTYLSQNNPVYRGLTFQRKGIK